MMQNLNALSQGKKIKDGMFRADRMETFPTTITEVTACIMYVCALSEIRSGYPHPPSLINCYLSAQYKQ